MIKKVLLVAVLAFWVTGSAHGQQQTTTRPNVLIDYFWRPTNVDFNIAEQLRNYVIEGITTTKRVELIDVDSQDALKIEQARRQEGVDSEGDLERLKVMSQVGADYILQGRITSLAVEKRKIGKTLYTAVLNYTLKIIDPNDGKLVHSQTFKYGDEFLNLEASNTAEAAVVKACRSAVKDIRQFIETSFPIMGTILEVDEQTKSEVRSIYISVGEKAGVNKKDRFSLNIKREVAGRSSLKEIGECEIKAVEGTDISLAVVKKGGKELKHALEAGQTVVLKSLLQKNGILNALGL